MSVDENLYWKQLYVQHHNNTTIIVNITLIFLSGIMQYKHNVIMAGTPGSSCFLRILATTLQSILDS
jgi:hypothetical protein